MMEIAKQTRGGRQPERALAQGLGPAVSGVLS